MKKYNGTNERILAEAKDLETKADSTAGGSVGKNNYVLVLVDGSSHRVSSTEWKKRRAY